MTEFADVVGPAVEATLEPGETLEGICAASQQQGLFKGRVVALAVTDRRLLVQPLDRRSQPAGDAESVRPEEIAGADAGGVSGGWPNLGAAVMDRAAVKLTIRTTGGAKLKLMMMRGGGRLGGGEGQSRGVEALGRFFERLDAPPRG